MVSCLPPRASSESDLAGKAGHQKSELTGALKVSRFILLPGIMAILFCLGGCTSQDDLDIHLVRASVVKIQVESAAPRYDQPWLYNSPRSSSGTGFYIGDGRILTNAHVVAHGKYITVQRDGKANVALARVQHIAHDSDLAILELQDNEYLKGARALEFGGMPKLREPVSAVGYPMGGEQISVTKGVVSRISYRRYAHTGMDSHVLVQVDSAINPGNSGGPVFQGGKVVGVAFQAFTRAENTGYIIPTPVVERFLNDIKSGRYDGHPFDGLLVQDGALENPIARQYFGLAANEGGVLVHHVSRNSALYQAIQPGDILLSVAGHDIGVDGKIAIYGERLDFRTPMDLALKDEEFSVTVIRDGERKQINTQVAIHERIDFWNHRFQRHPRFLIYGGLIFTSLSRNYLQTWGQHWYFKSPVQLRYVHQFFDLDPQFAKRDEAIVLLGRLPDAVNQSSIRFQGQVLNQLNRQAVSGLEHLASLLEENPEGELLLDFFYQNAPLVLDHEGLARQHPQILERYRVGLERWLDEALDGATANWGGH